MKGVRKNYDNCCTLSFLLVFLVLILLRPVFSINILSSTEYLTISGNGTLVSPGEVFELGFFRTTSSSRWYLGIWYKKVYFRTYVWVANRDNPLSRSIGTLRISNMNLVLLDHSNKSVWSTNLTRGNVSSPVVAELLPNGNFVMRYSNNDTPSGFLWQSFDFPTDTLLPGMKLGYHRKTGRSRFLTSWRSSDDPSSGYFTYELDTRRGLPEFFVMYNDIELYRGGPWNGIEFSGIPKQRKPYYMMYNYTDNGEEVTYKFFISEQSTYSRLTIDFHGILYQLAWIPPTSRWTALSTLPTDFCDNHINYCESNRLPTSCSCLQGFDRIPERSEGVCEDDTAELQRR
uniref:S-locus receptor kinase n=1 Tax=Brassica napus TaxID=3708 RepID=Q6SV93_BRANA|nr:S-locus receptor kinase [Brassica napus]